MVPDSIANSEATYMGGGQIAILPPVFKKDGTCLYVACRNQINGYNCKSGRKVQEFIGLNEQIVGFGCIIKNGEECIIACSTAGKIFSWNIETAEKLREHVLSQRNIKSFIPVSDYKANKSKAIVVYQNSSINLLPENESVETKPILTIGYANMKKGTIQQIPIDIQNTETQDYCMDIAAVESGDQFLVFTQERLLYYVDLKSNRTGAFFIRQHMLGAPKLFTAVHIPRNNPRTPDCAVGDSLGRITLYTNLRDTIPIRTVLHWHTLPVRCLAASRAATRLYSGGGEAVLVKWTLMGDGAKFGGDKLGYVPRLGGEVRWIGVGGEDGDVVAVVVEGEGIRVMGDNDGGEGEREVWIRPGISMGSNLDVGLVYDNRSKCIILNGTSGKVQFCSPAEGTLLYSMDVVRHNRLTNERNQIMANVLIKHVAANEKGFWYATVEERKETDAIYELRLKFWKFDAESQKFHLNTSIEYPHDDAITGIEFRPNRKGDKLDQCVTISRDGLFKNWHLIEIMGVDGALSLTWRCATTAYYKPPFFASCLSFSEDGSVLALGYGHALTIWLPDTCQLKRSLTTGEPKFDFVKSVAFGRGRCNYLIVGVTKGNLSVWNLLTYAVTLSVEMDIVDLISDPSSNVMAVLRKDNSVYFFEPDQSSGLKEQKIPEKDVIEHCTFIPQEATDGKFENYSTKFKSQFFYINSKYELFCLGARIKTPESSKEYLQIQASHFSHLLAEKLITTVKKQENRKIIPENSNRKSELKKLLDTPNHTQIPLSLLACSFLHSLVLNERTSSRKESVENAAEGVSYSSTDGPEQAGNGNTVKRAGPTPGTLINLNKLKIRKTDWVKIL